MNALKSVARTQRVNHYNPEIEEVEEEEVFIQP